MTLSEISKSHVNALKIFNDGITVWPVVSEEIRTLGVARQNLQKSVDRFQAAEPLKKFVSICSQLHARICRSPCRPSWLFETFKPQLQELQPRLKPALSAADQRLKLEYEIVIEKLAAVRKMKTNPLAEAVRQMLTLSEEASEKLIVVIRQQSLWPEVQAALDPANQRKNLLIMKPSELRRASPVDRLILFGPPWLFKFRGEEFLFSSPVAASIELFLFEHDSGGQLSTSAFGGQTLLLKGIQSRPIQPEDLQGEPLFMFKPRSFIPRASSVTIEEVPDEHAIFIQAWPVNLGGSHGTYLDPEGSAHVLEVTNDGERTICTGIGRRDIEDLEPGDLIVLTTEGGGDMIRPMADEILEEHAQAYRQLQDKWKRKLREQVDAEGMSTIVARLRNQGSPAANPPNVRTWMSPRNIGPDRLDTDFEAILAILGINEARDQYCEAIDSIRRAHKQAGFQLRDRLLSALKGMDVRKSFVDGFLEVRTAINGPAKTIFLVEQINREAVSVPSHTIGRVVELEDPQS
jgi:hypothetical protein